MCGKVWQLTPYWVLTRNIITFCTFATFCVTMTFYIEFCMMHRVALPARITSQPHAGIFHQSEAHIEEDDMYNVPDEEPSMNGGEPEDDLYIVDLDSDSDAVVNFPSMFYLVREH